MPGDPNGVHSGSILLPALEGQMAASLDAALAGYTNRVNRPTLLASLIASTERDSGKEETVSRIGKATWAHLPQSGPEAVRDLVRQLGEAQFDAVIPCLVHPDGYAMYQSRIARVRPTISSWDPLEVLCDEAHRVGLAVHAWNCIFTEGAHSSLLEKRPDVVGRDRSGVALTQRGKDDEGWVCPARPESHAHELALYQEMIDNYDVDAIHIDYIRFKDERHCFCDYCRTHFQREIGVDPATIDFEHEKWSDWMDWRAAHITRFAEAVRERATAADKTVSAGVFADYPDCISGVGQDWEDWGKRGIVDVMMPMNYTASAAIAAKRTRNHVHALEGCVPLWEGLFLRKATTTAMLVEQIERVLDAGAQGFVIFECTGIFGRPLLTEDFSAINAIL